MTPHLTRHLTPEELIDSRERQLPPARQAHLDACIVCRAERARLEEVLRDVAAVDVPEPSPLFWDHLSARIRERVAHEPPPTAASEGPLAPLAAFTDWLMGKGSAPRWAFAAALLALCAGLGWVAWSGLRGVDGVRTPTGASASASSSPSSPSGSPLASGPTSTASSEPGATDAVPAHAASAPGLDADHEWTLMVRMAEDVSWDDDAEGPSLDVRPAAVDRALIELTAEERDRLLQLVRDDLARQKSS